MARIYLRSGKSLPFVFIEIDSLCVPFTERSSCDALSIV